jgi:hypothetical protein
MVVEIEQRICIKFCCKIGKLAAELLKGDFRDNTFGKSAVCRWYANLMVAGNLFKMILALDVHSLQKLLTTPHK